MQPIMNYFSNIPSDVFKKRMVTLAVIVCLVIAALFFAWDYFVSQKAVTLNPTPGTTITIGTQSGDAPVISNVITSTDTKKTIRLRPGLYAVKFSGSKDYQDELLSVQIDGPVEIDTPTLSYTKDKLAKLLITEEPAIQQALLPYMPTAGYSTDLQQLFGNGSWYGARLIPGDWYDSTAPANVVPKPINALNTQDMLKVIMEKVGGKWTVVASPQVVVPIADYPKIPQGIIRQINALGTSGTGQYNNPSTPNTVTNKDDSLLQEVMSESSVSSVDALISKAVLYNISISNNPNASSEYTQNSSFTPSKDKLFKENASYSVGVDDSAKGVNAIHPLNGAAWNYWFTFTTDDGRHFRAEVIVNPATPPSLISIKKI